MDFFYGYFERKLYIEARSDKDNPLEIRNDGQKSSIQIRVVDATRKWEGWENLAYLAEDK